MGDSYRLLVCLICIIQKFIKKNLKKTKQNSAPSLACWQLQIHIFFHILYINAPRSAVDNRTCSAVPICLFVVCFPFKIHTSPGPHRQIRRFKTPFSPCTGLSCNMLLTALSPTSPLFPSVQFNKFNSVSINWASSPCKALRVKQNKGSASVLGCDFTTGEKCSLPFPWRAMSLGTKGSHLDTARFFIPSQVANHLTGCASSFCLVFVHVHVCTHNSLPSLYLRQLNSNHFYCISDTSLPLRQQWLLISLVKELHSKYFALISEHNKVSFHQHGNTHTHKICVEQYDGIKQKIKIKSNTWLAFTPSNKQIVFYKPLLGKLEEPLREV